MHRNESAHITKHFTSLHGFSIILAAIYISLSPASNEVFIVKIKLHFKLHG